MPQHYARRLLGAERTAHLDAHLGLILAFVAGAVNAGGFLAIHQYTSHMTGMVSAAADGLALGSTEALMTAVVALITFAAGASCTSLLVNFGRSYRAASVFALPLLVESVCLIAFGLLGALVSDAGVVPIVAGLLCFTMGLQNALITKVSKSEIRTTHVTGIVTDIGIELGRLGFGHANKSRLRLLGGLLAAFAAGGLLGAEAFKTIGHSATFPLAVGLGFLGGVLAFDDLKG